MSQADRPWRAPDWKRPPGVEALQTERGTTRGWGFNLAEHVGAPAAEVAANRAALLAGLPAGSRIGWLRQIHGVRVVELPQEEGVEADAAISREPGQVCAVMTADCLPVLMASEDGRTVAAAHAGWRGLAAGVIEATLAALAVPPAQLRVWLGPRIGPRHFEVGPDVLAAFRQGGPEAMAAFRPRPGSDRLLADLGELARQRLARLGVVRVTDSGSCTYEDAERWYSFRREGRCGRMASLIRPRA